MTEDEYNLILEQQQLKRERRKTNPSSFNVTQEGANHPDTVSYINNEIAKEESPTIGQIAGSIGTEVVGAGAGNMAAIGVATALSPFPPAAAIAYTGISFGTGYAASVAAQKIEGGEFSYGRAIAGGLLNLIPSGQAAKATKTVVGTVAKRVSLEGAKGSAMAMGDLTIARVIDEQEIPNGRELLKTGVIGFGFGATLGGTVEAGKAVYNKVKLKPKSKDVLTQVKDKTPDEIDTMVRNGEIKGDDVKEALEDFEAKLIESRTIDPEQPVNIPESNIRKRKKIDKRKLRRQKRKEKQSELVNEEIETPKTKDVDEPETPTLDETEPSITPPEADSLLEDIIKEYNVAKQSGELPIRQPEFIKKFRDVFDAADEDFTRQLELLGRDPDNSEVLYDLLETIEIQEKTLTGGLGELNKGAGDGVRANNINVTSVDGLKYSVDTEDYLSSLRSLKKTIARRIIRSGDDEIIDNRNLRESIDNILGFDARKSSRKEQFKFDDDVDLDGSEAQIIGNRARVSKVNEMLDELETKAEAEAPDAVDTPVKEGAAKTKAEKLQAELERKQKEFSGQQKPKDKKKPKPDTKEEADLKERIKFYNRASKEADEIASLEDELETLRELAKKNNLVEIKAKVGGDNKFSTPETIQSYKTDLQKAVREAKSLLKKKVTTTKPKKKPKTRAEKLQEALDEEREFFTGEKEVPQPKRKISDTPEERELRDKINFYRTNRKEANKIALLEDELEQLRGVAERNNILEIQNEVGGRKPDFAKPEEVSSYIKDLEKAVRAGRKLLRTKVDPKKPVKTPQQKAAEANARIVTRLEKRLDTLRKGFGDDEGLDAATARKESEELRPKKEQEILELEEKIAFYKANETEVRNIDKLDREVDRLTDMIARGDELEIRQELETKPNIKTRSKTIKGRLAAAQKQVKTAKQTLAKNLRDIDEDVVQTERMDFYNKVYQTQLQAAKLDKMNGVWKFVNNLRVARKLAMVNSATSIQAGVPTAAFEVLRQPFTNVGQFFADTSDVGITMAARLMKRELAASTESIKVLFSKDQYRYMARAFFQSKDPSLSRGIGDKLGFNQVARGTIFRNSNEQRIYDLATGNAKLQQSASNWLYDWVGSRDPLSIISNIYQIGKRGIVAVDSGAQRQLQYSRRKAKYARMAVMKHPNDKAKETAYFNELMAKSEKDVNGLNIISDEANLQEEFAKISDNLLMSSHLEIEDVKRGLGEKLLVAIDEALQAKTGNNAFSGAFIEFLQPFFKIGVTTVARGGRFAVPFAPALSNLGNQHRSVVKELTQKHTTFSAKLLQKRAKLQVMDKNTAAYKRIKIEIDNDTKFISDLERRMKNANVRKVRKNAEDIGDTMIQFAAAGAAFELGRAGLATGFNSYLTADQRKGSPNMQNFHILGMDYSSWVPLSLNMAVFADLGAYMKAKEEGRLAPELQERIDSGKGNWWSIMMTSANRAIAEVPFMQSYKQAIDLLDEDKQKDFLTKQFSSYAPTISQARKWANLAFAGDSMVDLRGGEWWERAIYHQYGFGIGTLKTAKRYDILGNPLQTGNNFSRTVNRFAGKTFKEPTKIEEALGRDQNAVITKQFPKMFDVGVTGANIDMTEWYDNKGNRLIDVVANKVRTDGILESELDAYFASGGYDIESYFTDDTKRVSDVRIQKIIRREYNRVFTELRIDPSFTDTVINKQNQSLYDYIQEKTAEAEQVMSSPPPSNNPRIQTEIQEFTNTYK